MPFGVAGAVLGGVASAATSSLLSHSGGSSSPNIGASQQSGGSGISNFQGGYFSSPALVFSGVPGTAGVSNLATQSILQRLTDSTDQSNNALTGMLGLVDPTYGNLVNGRVAAIHNAALKATSDLSGNLASRRVLGSSFGQNAVAQVALQAGQDEADQRAQGTLESIDATMKILGQRLTNNNALVQQELSQAQFDTSAGINLINGTQQTFSDNSAVLAQLAQANASGLGAASAGISSAVGNGVTSLVNNAFSSPVSNPMSLANNTPNAQTVLGGSLSLPGFD